MNIPSQRKPPLEEDWFEIDFFPGYSVSHTGLVRNDRSPDHYLTRLANQSGVAYVGLSRDGKQHNRSVALLVAESFLPRHEYPAFDTPIHLDGDRTNNHVQNLMWRPRWFAVTYHQQFFTDQRGIHPSIQEIDTGEKFKSSWDAVVKYGLWHKEIVRSTIDGRTVWPTHQRFRHTHTIPRQIHGV